MAWAKLLTAASETICGVRISKPSVGDFTLKRFPFTCCPLHQSEGRQGSRHNEQLPSDPASGCWFIYLFFFIFLTEETAVFDWSGSRTWMRSLAKTAREGELHRPGKGSSYPWLPLHLQCCTCIAAEVVMLIETWETANFNRKRGAIHAKSVPLSRQKFLIDPVCAAVPSDQITDKFFMTPAPTFQLTLTHNPYLLVPGWVLKSPGGLGKVKRHEGAPNPEFLLPAAVIVPKPQCFHGS